jgi:hypothetical protein
MNQQPAQIAARALALAALRHSTSRVRPLLFPLALMLLALVGSAAVRAQTGAWTEITHPIAAPPDIDFAFAYYPERSDR